MASELDPMYPEGKGKLVYLCVCRSVKISTNASTTMVVVYHILNVSTLQ